MEADLCHSDGRTDRKEHDEATSHFSQFRERAEKTIEQHERFWLRIYQAYHCKLSNLFAELSRKHMLLLQPNHNAQYIMLGYLK